MKFSKKMPLYFFYTMVQKCQKWLKTQIMGSPALKRKSAGLEKSTAIRPLATKISRLASEKFLLADSLATESCRLADRLATKLFFKADNADVDRTWSRKVRCSLCRSKMRGSCPFVPRRSCLRVNPPPGSWCLPSDSPFETIWAWWGGGNIVRVVTVSLRGTSVIHMNLFQFGFERRKCSSASAETSVRRERPVKEEKEEFEEEGSKEDGAQRGSKRRKVPKSQYNVLQLHEDKLPLWLQISQSIKQ